MAAQLVMADPGQPVKHEPSHDLESIFYVLIGVFVWHISPYFSPAIDLLTHLHGTLISPMSIDIADNFHCETPFTHDIFINALIDTLLHLKPNAWEPHHCPKDDKFMGQEAYNSCDLKLDTTENTMNAAPDMELIVAVWKVIQAPLLLILLMNHLMKANLQVLKREPPH